MAILVLALLFGLVGCGSSADQRSTTAPGAVPTTPGTTTPVESATPVEAPTATPELAVRFPVETFAAIRAEPVADDLAARFQAALEEFAGSDDFAEGGGLTATVMSADGTWSGTVGTADGVRDLQVDDQFAIASITKSVIAAQVIPMVEAGELELDDAVANHSRPDLQFDTNGATIRPLPNHSSGFPDDWPVFEPLLRRVRCESGQSPSCSNGHRSRSVVPARTSTPAPTICCRFGYASTTSNRSSIG